MKKSILTIIVLRKNALCVVRFLAQKCAKPKRGRLVLGNAEMNYGKGQVNKLAPIIPTGKVALIIDEVQIGRRTEK